MAYSRLSERTLASLIADTPNEVNWGAVIEEDDFDVRRSCVDILFVNTIGVNEGYYEWCPNDEPPDLQERIAWIWAVRPDLSQELLPHAKEDLAILLQHFIDGRMDRWWSS